MRGEIEEFGQDVWLDDLTMRLEGLHFSPPPSLVGNDKRWLDAL